MCLPQGLQAALEEAAQHAGPRVVVPIPGASEELQPAAFIDAETVARIAAASAAQPKGPRLTALGAVPGSRGPAGGQGAEVKKLEPVRPVKGASDALQPPKIAQVTLPGVQEL